MQYERTMGFKGMILIVEINSKGNEIDPNGCRFSETLNICSMKRLKS